MAESSEQAPGLGGAGVRWSACGATTTAVFLVLAAMPLVAHVLDMPFVALQATQIMIMAIAALSLDLILGYGGMVSFGHAAFMGIGAYVVGVLGTAATSGEPVFGLIPGTTDALVAWPLAVVIAAAVAFVIGLVSLRTSGMYFIMITLAFAEMVFYGFVGWQAYGGDDGLPLAGRSELPGLDLTDGTIFYYIVFLALLVCFWFGSRIVGSRFGMVIRGVRQNEKRLGAVGFRTMRFKLAAFVIAGAMGGFSGALLANYQFFVSPADASWVRSGELIAMVVLGGMGTLVGPIIGAAVYILLKLAIGSYTTHWQIVFGPLLVLIVMFGRNGIIGVVLAWAAGRAGRRA